MRRRRFAYITISILVVIGIWVATRTERPTDRTSAEPTLELTPSASATATPTDDETNADVSPAAPQPRSAASPVPPGAAAPAASVAPPDAQAMVEVDQVSLMIRDYRSVMGENPVGTNAEIMQAVMGGNPKEAKVGPPEGMQVNEKGELIDRWGRPYFFHQLARDQMEIRSAGADKVMWTDDDPVAR